MDWPIIFECNENCISCIYDTRQRGNQGTPFLGEVKDVVDSLDPESDGDNDHITFTGGEPTIRKEFFSILKYTRDKYPDMYMAVVTNGRIFSQEEKADRLAEVVGDNFQAGVAFYSHRPEVHDAVTRVEGSWEDTFKGLKNLIERDIRIELRIIVGRYNYQHLDETAEFVKEELPGIERVTFINMKYTGNAYRNRDRVFVRYEESNPEVQKAVDVLEGEDMELRMFHFPLCTIDRKYWDYAKGVTKQEQELMLLDKCEQCAVKDACPKIWKSYWVISQDESEFEAVKNP